MTSQTIHTAPSRGEGVGLAEVLAPAEGIYRGVTVRVAHREGGPSFASSPAELGVVVAIAFNGDPTVELDNGSIFIAYREVYVVRPVSRVASPDERTTGRWNVSRRRRVVEGTPAPYALLNGEPITYFWFAAPEVATEVDKLDADDLDRYGARAFPFLQHGKAVAYAARMARRNLR